MKTFALLVLLSLGGGLAQARPIKIPTYAELFEMAELVAVLSLVKIEASEALSPGNPNPKKYRNYLAHCRVEHAFKGKAKTVVIPFFQDPAGKPGFNGAMVAPFSEHGKVDYLVYLKRPRKHWVPAAGSLDAALSIKAMPFSYMPRVLKLP